MSPTNIFAPAYLLPPIPSSGSLYLSLLNVAAIFVVVFGLLAYVVVRFRHKPGDERLRSCPDLWQ